MTWLQHTFKLIIRIHSSIHYYFEIRVWHGTADPLFMVYRCESYATLTATRITVYTIWARNFLNNLWLLIPLTEEEGRRAIKKEDSYSFCNIIITKEVTAVRRTSSTTRLPNTYMYKNIRKKLVLSPRKSSAHCNKTNLRQLIMLMDRTVDRESFSISIPIIIWIAGQNGLTVEINPTDVMTHFCNHRRRQRAREHAVSKSLLQTIHFVFFAWEI